MDYLGATCASNRAWLKLLRFFSPSNHELTSTKLFEGIPTALKCTTAFLDLVISRARLDSVKVVEGNGVLGAVRQYAVTGVLPFSVRLGMPPRMWIIGKDDRA